MNNNAPEQAAGRVYAKQAERARINAGHMREGVQMIDPERTYIDEGVKIGEGTVIYPGAIIEGDTAVGRGCVIGANTRLVNARLGDSVDIWYSVVIGSEIGDSSEVGPFAYVRPGSQIGRHARIGDFVEIKNSSIGDNTKVSHLTYVGDADVGEGVNFGCGTVTVNYDGAEKHRTAIGDRAFIGCNTNLVAPVNVGRAAYTAAGSTITGDVPEGCMSIARARQIDLPGRAEKYLKKK